MCHGHDQHDFRIDLVEHFIWKTPEEDAARPVMMLRPSLRYAFDPVKRPTQLNLKSLRDALVSLQVPARRSQRFVKGSRQDLKSFWHVPHGLEQAPRRQAPL